jgi:hypothetical protein
VGRRVGASLNRDDVTSAYCQRRTGVQVQSLTRWNTQEGGWDERMIEDRNATPAQIAVLRSDVWAWLASLPWFQELSALLNTSVAGARPHVRSASTNGVGPCLVLTE